MNGDATTMERRWEYCAVVSHAGDTSTSPVEWLCRVSYFHRDGVRTTQLRTAAGAMSMDMFERALAQLGAAGWELVSIQHELVRNNLSVPGEQFLASVHTGYSLSAFGVAYLKRTIQEGRAIDEPRIVMDDQS